jgi:2-dehydro-3-deoxyglucarate aldolase
MKNKNSIGSWITIGHSSIAEVMADAGFDWLCIDLEHSVIDFGKMQELLIAIQSKGLKAYVRIGENNSRIIKRVLDAGPDGIIIPNVKSTLEAKKAVESFKYPPLGNRGVGLARAQNYGFDFENYRDYKTKDLILIAQIEHINALEELDNIIKLDGIDGTFIGPYDLSGSLGKTGKLNDPKVLNAIDSYLQKAKKYNKLIGFHVVPIDYKLVLEKMSEGYNFIAFGFDAYFLGSSIRNQLKNIK